MVMVQNQEEEAALGREWSRTPLPPERLADEFDRWVAARKDQAAALPKEEKPEPEPEEEEPEEEKPVEEPPPATVPVRAPVRKAAARKPAGRTKTHKR